MHAAKNENGTTCIRNNTRQRKVVQARMKSLRRARQTEDRPGCVVPVVKILPVKLSKVDLRGLSSVSDLPEFTVGSSSQSSKECFKDRLRFETGIVRGRVQVA